MLPIRRMPRVSGVLPAAVIIGAHLKHARLSSSASSVQIVRPDQAIQPRLYHVYVEARSHFLISE